MARHWQMESFTRYSYRDFKKSTLPSTWRDILGIFVAEFWGTCLLIIFGCLAFMNATPKDDKIKPNWFYAGFCYGSIAMFLTTAFIQVSGALMNPAITIWAVIYGTMPVLLAPIYLLAQFVGAIVGYGCLKGFFIEFLTTAVLAFVYCGVWDHRCESFFDSSPLKIGLTYLLLIMVTGLTTQCGMNPARSFAAAIYNGKWQDHWIFWIAPILGSIAATVFYKLVFSQPLPKKQEELTIKHEPESKVDQTYIDKVIPQTDEKPSKPGYE